MSDLTVPEEFDNWPFDVRSFVLAEANTAVELREQIDSLAGLSSDDWESDNAGAFTKTELATLVMALGGPQGGDAQ
ncbi:hypothetical protein [Halomarina rubra]|uniref:Uncharacterized protein n=1 Tax=Halomarina rubra TaxID=2071873 RepID=A0ABD6AZ78_9EURY|nr:hypothetical protein [Halomarina rubra]